ncbi:hypothetical protein [Desulfomicrobium salsuginis]
MSRACVAIVFLLLVHFTCSPAFASQSSRTITRSDLPDTISEAVALLQLMADEPGRTQYHVVFDVPGEITVFGCDLVKEVLIRVHQRPSGRGSQEVWAGYVMERLRAGATGETLNTTPLGKIFGTHESF